MSKAYIATSEKAQLVVAFDKNPSKAMKSVAKKIDQMSHGDEWLMLTSINVGYDEEGFYHITATVSSVNI
ncbi:MAG: hypothetical protein WAO31_04835 [Rhodoluna sp.]